VSEVHVAARGGGTLEVESEGPTGRASRSARWPVQVRTAGAGEVGEHHSGVRQCARGADHLGPFLSVRNSTGAVPARLPSRAVTDTMAVAANDSAANPVPMTRPKERPLGWAQYPDSAT